jgi:plastocyanin
VLLLAACSRPAAVPKTIEVAMRNFGFTPDTLRVSPGDTIVFHNYDVVPHTATAAGIFDSDSIGAGGEWRWVVGDAGRYDYICAYHPTMRGLILTDHPSE